MNNNYNLFGIRFDNREFGVGEELPKSLRWEDSLPTEEELSGTCVIFVSDESNFIDYLDGNVDVDDELDRYIEALKRDEYPAKHVYLVAINSRWGWEWGEDEGEIIMDGAEVVRKIK